MTAPTDPLTASASTSQKCNIREGFQQRSRNTWFDNSASLISSKWGMIASWKNMKKDQKALRYRFDRFVRSGIMWLMGRLTGRTTEVVVDLQREDIKKILLVRALFRLGDAILATPAILLLRENFPQATIDFVGPKVTKGLFRGLPINKYLEIHSNFPQVCWRYFTLINRLRSQRYDLAIDVSGSSAAMGSFIVGFSGARWRVGLYGKWDHWFNVRRRRPQEQNKYGNLPELIASLGLLSSLVYPALILSPAEMAIGRHRLETSLTERAGPVVGIFVGGRRKKGKRWEKEKFLALASELRGSGLRPVIFVGPEEIELLRYFRQVFGDGVSVIFEPMLREFAALVANCQLFVACDSGPVHLACGLRVRTLAIFLKENVERWGPPAELGHITILSDNAPAAMTIADACLKELGALLPADVSPCRPGAERIATLQISQDVDSSKLATRFAR